MTPRTDRQSDPLLYGGHPPRERRDPGMERFRHYRLGQFVHFGLYALPAGSWHGHSYEGAAEFLPKWASIPPAEWRTLAADYRLPAFSADAWADAAVRMGARYVTITTKHHEGFCLWPTAQTDFHVGNTPYGRDLLGELITAYRQRGIAVHLYYSVLDWDHPDWRYTLDTEDDRAAFDRYLEFVTAQLVELAQRYPQVSGFWFDGTWDESVKANGRWTWETERLLKSMIPGVVVNSRLRADDHGARHFDSNGLLMGDFESGYERRLPDPWDDAITTQDWEACMTISEASWGHHAGTWAADSVKHPWELADMLAQVAAQGGNLLINIGPRGDGSLADREIAVTDRLGRWLELAGPAVLDSGPATGWRYPSWGYLTRPTSADTDVELQLIVTRPPVSGTILLELPAGRTVTAVRSPTDPTPKWRLRSPDRLQIEVDPNLEDGPVVFDLVLDSKATTDAFSEPNPDLAPDPDPPLPAN